MNIHYLYVLFANLYMMPFIGVFGSNLINKHVVDVRRFNQGVDAIIINITALVREQDHKYCLSDLQHGTELPLVELGKGIYYISKGLKATWFSAVDYCRLHGLNLVKIESKRENQFIISYLEALDTKSDYWIGGTDAGSEKHFYWQDNEQSIVYDNEWKPWASGQPDNIGQNENCIELWGPHNFKWNDRNCKEFRYFICELLI